MVKHVKRPKFLFFQLEDEVLFNIQEFLRGIVRLEESPHLVAISLVSASRVSISIVEVKILQEIPVENWTPVEDVGAERSRIEFFIDKGLLLCDSEDSSHKLLRQRHERLVSNQWHPYAALYHFMLREGETTKPVDIELAASDFVETVSQFVEKNGPPPPAFYQVENPGKRSELPLEEGASNLVDLLKERKTVRGFDLGKQIKLGDFSRILRYTFGCCGTVRPTEDVTILQKTSPSGGGLHPIEVYPLVLNVESLEIGFYHYNVEHHAVDLVHKLDLPKAKKLATDLCNEQSHAGSAHVLFVMVARFYRNFWKYRSQSRAYGVLLMDAGHLSQVFYLLATELGLGAFYTAAVDSSQVDSYLESFPEEMAVIGVCACGVKRGSGTDLGLNFSSFSPERDPA